MHSFKIIRLDETVSTNTFASALLSDNEISFNSVVATKNQTGGRGQGDNSWESTNGSNVLCSIVVCPDFLIPHQQFRISKISAISIVDTLHHFRLKGSVKWPNDIIVDNKKIAGILIENTIESYNIKSSVIGIGLNVNQKNFSELSIPATSIILETGKQYEPDKVLDVMLDKFEFWYNKLAMGDSEDVDIYYLENLYGLNRELTFRMGGKEFNAVIIGVGESGKLYVRREDGKIIKALFREIEYIL